MIKPWDFQIKAIDIGVQFFRDRSNREHGIIVISTGGGKSLISANIAKELGEDVLILQPSKEILEQNYEKLVNYGYKASIYSASMNQKKISSITFATIGSVISKKDHFRHFKNIIVDECDLVNAKGGMYSELIKHIPNVKVLGLTATPYRLASNSFGTELRFITRTKPRVFSRLLYYVQTGDLFRDGKLCPLVYHEIKGFDRSKLRLNSNGSDYDEKALMRYYKSSGFEEKLVRVVQRLIAVKRKNILVFTRGLQEAYNLQRYIMGSVVITGETPKKEREKILADFKSGIIRVVINVGVLCVGFDFPQLETVVMARPTLSLRLWYQIVGRGTRIHPSKPNCWIVDMCDNLRVFGKVEDLRIEFDNMNRPIITSNGRQLTNTYFSRVAEAV